MWEKCNQTNPKGTTTRKIYCSRRDPKFCIEQSQLELVMSLKSTINSQSESRKAQNPKIVEDKSGKTMVSFEVLKTVNWTYVTAFTEAYGVTINYCIMRHRSAKDVILLKWRWAFYDYQPSIGSTRINVNVIKLSGQEVGSWLLALKVLRTKQNITLQC